MVHEITLMDAYLIEALKTAEVPDNEILEAVSQQKIENLKDRTGGSFDFTSFYEIEAYLPEILQNGYQVKFLTFPGLKRLLELKLEKKEDVDYTVHEFQIEGLALTSIEKVELETFLSRNWMIESTDGGVYTIKPKTE